MSIFRSIEHSYNSYLLEKKLEKKSKMLRSKAIILKKIHDRELGNVEDLAAKIDKLNSEKIQLNAKFTDDMASKIVLRVVSKNDLDNRSIFTKAIDAVVGSDSRLKVGGHIMYFNKNMDLTWYDVLSDDVDNIFKIKRKDNQGEAYMLDDYFGSYKGKKIFLAKYPYAISLKLVQEKFDMETDGTEGSNEKDPDLAYDSKSYYNLLEHTIKRNITKAPAGGFDLMKTISDYWIVLLIAAAAAFLFLTPQGKQMMMQIAAQLKLS